MKKQKIDEKFALKLVQTYHIFLKELDEYENDPYRSRTNFFERDESFEAFMKWLDWGFIV